ncbi:MAG: 16S rRNA processing protein RimM [Candidatus Hydrogenedentes bacterium CG07_land_8_20_14_0_80_42_17]|nr:MAG: 16S rRNA processing protein RimM [Candidatus Hydrogenedentes bacterium CG1_02_42_14]PIU47561.1 MAG: 16S rRNA processing protein RimM [Candidatus Hydrogenedentes bacterium CG07_land_8_20_14_0_80_42_17]
MSAKSKKILLARLGKPHGLKGEIELHLETDRPLEVLAPGVYSLDDGRVIEVEELIVRGGKCFWVIANKPNREVVAQYTNSCIIVDSNSLPPRKDGYNDFELIGLDVRNSNGKLIGKIVGVEHRYEIDTWLIKGSDSRQGEFPAVSEFIKSVDISAGVVILKGEVLWN